MRLRLLPEGRDYGYLPYIWLVYLVFFLSRPILTDGDPQWGLTVVGVGIFLVLYFAGYWLVGIRKLYAIGGLLLLGALYAPMNSGASVFFIYAGGFVGELGTAALAYRVLAVILASIATVAYFVQPHPGFWLPALMFTTVIGVVDVHFAHRRRMNLHLQLAHDEIERLAKIAERERIARDLHDLLGHTLSVIVLKSELASKLADKDTPRAIAEIRDVERISREALAEVRAAVKGYRSMSLAAEARTAADALQTVGVMVETKIDAVNLSATQESVLAMVLREAATNIVRHARATACRVHLYSSGGLCLLEVSDNGSGGNVPEGSGLSGMRRRIEELGGTVERDGSRGTRLLVRLPLSST